MDLVWPCCSCSPWFRNVSQCFAGGSHSQHSLSIWSQLQRWSTSRWARDANQSSDLAPPWRRWMFNSPAGENNGKPMGNPWENRKLTESPGENPCCWRRIVRDSAAVQFPNPFAGVPRMSHGRSWVLPWKRWVKIQEVDSPMVFPKPAWSLTPWCWHGKNLSWKSTPWPLDTSWQTSPGAWERPNHLRKEPRRPSIVPWLSGS